MNLNIKLNMMKIYLLVLLFFVTAGLYSQNFTCSSTPSCLLTVWNKYDGIEGKTVKFEVVNKNTNEKYYYTVKAANNNPIEISFPSSGKFTDTKNIVLFSLPSGGTFTWKCFIDDKLIVEGEFSIGKVNENLQFK